MTARGIRNNNPGNIRRSKDKWQGAAEDQSGDTSFVVFKSPEYGIRAMCRILLKYRDRGLDTVGEIIRAWAPTVENDTDAYIKSVCRATGVLPDDVLDIDDAAVMAPLVKAIIKHENGVQPYSDDVVMNGLRLAGIDGAEPKPLTKSRTITAGVGTSIGGGVALAAEVSRQVSEVREAIEPTLSAVTWLQQYGLPVALTAVVAFGAWVVWSRYQDRKRLGH